MNSQDSTFVTQAGQAGMAEVQLAALALHIAMDKRDIAALGSGRMSMRMPGQQ